MHPNDYKWEQADSRSREYAVFHTTNNSRMCKGTTYCHCAQEHCHRITTLCRTIYKACEVIVGKGWYRRIVIQADASFHRIIDHKQKALR